MLFRVCDLIIVLIKKRGEIGSVVARGVWESVDRKYRRLIGGRNPPRFFERTNYRAFRLMTTLARKRCLLRYWIRTLFPKCLVPVGDRKTIVRSNST